MEGKDRSIIDLQKTEQITSKEVRNWIHTKERAFTQALMEFSKETEQGFEIDSRRSSYGEYTGKFMCPLASAAIEQAIRTKFGEKVDVYSFGIRTTYKDDPSLIDNFHMDHQVVKFRTLNDEEEWTIDATYRQFQPKINPFKVAIFPSKHEDKLYTYKEALERIKRIYSNSPAMIDKYTPKRHKPGELYQNYKEFAQLGALGPHGVERLENLIQILLE